MGKMEIESKKRRKKRRIQQAVLAAVGTVGLMSVAMVAPNIFQVLPIVMGKERYKLTFRAHTALQRLAIKGHIRFVERNGVRYAAITEKGRSALILEQARLSHMAGKKRKWDSRYRVVAFDVPEKRRNIRDRLRNTMSDLGFLQLQKSMWIYPYDCEDLVALVKADLRIGKDVLYMIVDSIENDRWIKEHFKLP
ncbi:MAG: hypothetical protein UY70_C0012G0011 [Candidatus Kaiserbacteria bacterium GW2011_GWB1_52_6]|uniref:Transcriptional repressor PaaX-like central Cas2-like domain-containing protein n=2 Tax=Candidatus Kaiseribacteriota TaxID=1752734 RepID=A0A0G2A5G5_9BACT|nr:MAG: hypothetical protein UY67_C0010G0016 [Candidatus Kaiserbacteria bacterium GW2011_GWA2_52_12]KKW27539.1 MAG: hypothetical protein UY70_C0012G0011 [Candidatus Kaiserbacteria bacterium GW2011_GWB1_52_6]